MQANSLRENIGIKFQIKFFIKNIVKSTKALGSIAPPEKSYESIENNIFIPSGKPINTIYQVICIIFKIIKLYFRIQALIIINI